MPAIPASAAALIQIFGTLLFCAVFLFLWRHSGVTYFSYWSLAWGIEALARAADLPFPRVGSLLEFFFALALLVAARSAVPAPARVFDSTLRSIVLFPGLLLLVYVFGWRLPIMHLRALHSAVLALIFGYSVISIGIGSTLRNGLGGSFFRFTLGCLFLQFASQSVLYVWGGITDNELRWIEVFALVPLCLLAFSAMAMWIQNMQLSVDRLSRDIDRLRHEQGGPVDLDPLTGLQNRTALDVRLQEDFHGVVAVCDLDYFKDINDRFGHLVGDEVLRSVGHLIRASIRPEDDAFRWGGDEFVILFRHQELELVRGRMAALEQRLTTFRIRGHGLFPLGLSWGVADGQNKLLRPILDQADHQMYEYKRQAHIRAQR